MAHVVHEANRALQMIQRDPAISPHWHKAESWMRISAIEGVRDALAGATPEELHEAWVVHKKQEGWRYGTIKDAEAKTHPCMVPYNDLPEDQKLKDKLFLAIVDALK